MGDEVLSRLAQASESVFLCAPYVTGAVFATGTGRGFLRKLPRLSVTLLCNMSLRNVAAGVSDPEAVAQLLEQAPEARAYHLESLHAKLYVVDSTCAIVTSGNLTMGGLYRNVEYGVLIEDMAAVAQILRDLHAYATLGAPLDLAILHEMSVLAPALRRQEQSLRDDAARALPPTIRNDYTRVEDELLRRKLKGAQTVNAVFSQTILYVLAQGSLETKAIHERVREIHPDLCDDRVDRVIAGKHFGKKWKHAVRNAQMHLKRRGLIELAEGGWCLTRTATTTHTT